MCLCVCVLQPRTRCVPQLLFVCLSPCPPPSVFVTMTNTSAATSSATAAASVLPAATSGPNVRPSRCTITQGTTHCTCEPGYTISGRDSSICTGINKCLVPATGRYCHVFSVVTVCGLFALKISMNASCSITARLEDCVYMLVLTLLGATAAHVPADTTWPEMGAAAKVFLSFFCCFYSAWFKITRCYKYSQLRFNLIFIVMYVFILHYPLSC